MASSQGRKNKIDWLSLEQLHLLYREGKTKIEHGATFQCQCLSCGPRKQSCHTEQKSTCGCFGGQTRPRLGADWLQIWLAGPKTRRNRSSKTRQGLNKHGFSFLLLTGLKILAISDTPLWARVVVFGNSDLHIKQWRSWSKKKTALGHLEIEFKIPFLEGRGNF
jgi:hypothetical protein